MEGKERKMKKYIIATALLALLLASLTLIATTPNISTAALTSPPSTTQQQTTPTGKTVITGLHTIQSPINITGSSIQEGNILITSNGSSYVKMGPGVTITGLNGQPAVLDIYADSFTQAEPVAPSGTASVILIGNEQNPAVFQANGNITIGAVYDGGKLVGGRLRQEASSVYMKVNSSASSASGYIGDPLGFNRLIRSDTRTAIKVTQGNLTIYTQEYSSAFELLGIQIGATANVVITINRTHVVFDIEVPGIISEEWVNGINWVSLNNSYYNGVANFSQLAKDRALPSINFKIKIIGIGITIKTLDLDDLISLKETENNYYIDIISMEWGSGTVWETWTGLGVNPMVLSDGSVVLINNSKFTLRSSSLVSMDFSGGSTGVTAGLKIVSSGYPGPLVHIEALSIFADSWGCNSYMYVRGLKSVSMSNAKVESDGQEISSGATVKVDGYQEYPVSTTITSGGMTLTAGSLYAASLLLERDFGGGNRCVFQVRGVLNMPSGSSYISAGLVNLTGDTVINGVVSIDGKMRIEGSLTSTGDSDINGVSVLRNATMTASGTIKVEGSQLINGSLTMSGGGMLVDPSGILVTGSTEVSGSLDVDGRLKVTGNLTMAGDSIEMNVAPFTSMNVVSGSIETVNGYVEVTGDSIDMGGELSIIRGDIEISIVSFTSMRVESGSITTVNGFSRITGSGVSMGGESSVIEGVVSIEGKNVIKGSLTSTGDSDINGVSVLRNATMTASGTIKVEGSQLINGSLTMTDSTTYIGVSGILISGSVGIDGSLKVNGTLTVTGDATMKGDVIEMYGSSKITGSVELSGKMNVNNLLTGTVSLTADSLVTSGTTVIRGGEVKVVDGVLKVTKDGTEIACSVKITGDISSSGTLTLSNAKMNGATLIMAPTITYGATLVRGLMQILMGQLPASMLTNPMLTLGQVTMAQSLILGSTSIEGTMTVTPNGVIITGTTNIMGALNAFTAPSLGLGSTMALSSASALTSAGMLPLPSMAVALTTPMVATLALVGLIVARIIVPPVALAAGRAARRVQKKYFAPETRAYMIYYRARTRLADTAKATPLLVRYVAMKAGEGFFKVWSGPASKMASIELALQQQRKKLPMWFKSWHDRFMSRGRRRIRTPRTRIPRIRKH